MIVFNRSDLRAAFAAELVPFTMASAVRRRRFPRLWLILFLGGLSTLSRAQSPSVILQAPPAWVESFSPDLSNPAGLPPGSEKEKGESVKCLLRDEQTHAAEQTTYQHLAQQFLSQNGVQNNSTLTFNFNPAYETLRIHQLLVHRDGKTTDRLASQEIKILQREPDLEEQLYDGRLTATLMLADIRVGDVVEYAFSTRGTNPVFAGHFVDTFQAGWRAPLPRWRQRLLWPSDQPPPDIQNHGVVPAPQIRRLEGTSLIEYRWQADDLPGHPPEEETPADTDACAWVQLSSFTSWGEVAAWASKLFRRDAPDDPDALPEELRREVGVINLLPGREAKVVAALRYVQDNYRYLGIEIGANSHQPYPVATVCERRFGDCKDKANLLATLLRALGFEADPALVNTRYRGTLADWHPTAYAFDHAVTRLRLEGRDYWLDPTRRHQGGSFGHLYIRADGKALVVREDTTGLTDVSPGGLEESGVEVTDTFIQDHCGDPARLTVQSVYHGRDADATRGDFAEAGREEIQQKYLNYYAESYPKIRSPGGLEISDDRDKNEVVVTEHYEVDDFWQQDRDPESRWLYAHFEPFNVKSCVQVPAIRLRAMPMALPYPLRATEVIQVRLPAGMDYRRTQGEVKDRAFNFNFVKEYRRDQNFMVMTYHYQSLADRVEAARMPEYLAHTQRALDNVETELNASRQLFTGRQQSSATAPTARGTRKGRGGGRNNHSGVEVRGVALGRRGDRGRVGHGRAGLAGSEPPPTAAVRSARRLARSRTLPASLRGVRSHGGGPPGAGLPRGRRRPGLLQPAFQRRSGRVRHVIMGPPLPPGASLIFRQNPVGRLPGGPDLSKEGA